MTLSGRSSEPNLSPVLNRAQINVIWAIGRNKRFAYTRFAGRSHAKRAFVRSRKKRAEKGPLWPANGHYMGLNLGVFLKTEQYLHTCRCPIESSRGQHATGFAVGCDGIIVERGGLITGTWRDYTQRQLGPPERRSEKVLPNLIISQNLYSTGYRILDRYTTSLGILSSRFGNGRTD